MQYPLSHIAQLLSATIPATNAVIDTLLTDSRRLINPDSALFFSLKGPRRDGHVYIKELYEKGLRYFVVSQDVDENHYPDALFLRVPDTLLALQLLAAHHRSRFTIDVIGITGSNGKTVVKEWIFQLLQQDLRIVRSPKSYNSQVGVPLSVWQMNSSGTLALFEAGISRPGEMVRLEKIIKPNIGILTNIGQAHSEGFKDDEQKLQEKLKLFQNARVLIGNGDDPLLQKNIQHLSAAFFSWGKNESNAVRVHSIQKIEQQTSIVLQFSRATFTVTIPFIDNASIENAITCCAVLLYLKKDPKVIAERVSHLHAINMRLEYKKGINNCTIINDSYSSDINSLSIALDFLQQQTNSQNKTVILSDFAETREDDLTFYGQIASLLHQYHIDRLIGIGKKMQSVLQGILQNGSFHFDRAFYADTEEWIHHFQPASYKDEVILVKGARAFGFEAIVAILEQKVHQTILEINLNAVTNNLKSFQQLLKPDTKIMVMVKAFAYGSGGAEVAGLLQYHKADYLGVAYADEGVELRKAGITIPIMVLNSEIVAFDTITDNNLEPDLFSFEILDLFEQHLIDNGIKNYPVHLEVETGMNRLGFAISDIGQLGSRLKGNEFIRVVSVFSHLAASEDAGEDKFTLQQFDLLQKACAQLSAAIEYPFLRHIANSSGIIRHTQLQMDMVRLGIGLYGVGDARENLLLQPALTLKSTVAQVKRVKKGETVSYNRRGYIMRDSLIATVRIGYADGYNRQFGNGVGQMLVRGRLAPVVGVVCMDMTMIDVTDIKGVSEGDEVIIFGSSLPVETLAKNIGTIPYEIMTGISQRVKRLYWSE